MIVHRRTNADERRAHAVRVQVLRELGVDALSAALEPDWGALVAAIEREGMAPLAATVASLRAALEKANTCAQDS
ncbi:MAG: hypothetical protein WC683_01090 [bacterium]